MYNLFFYWSGSALPTTENAPTRPLYDNLFEWQKLNPGRRVSVIVNSAELPDDERLKLSEQIAELEAAGIEVLDTAKGFSALGFDERLDEWYFDAIRSNAGVLSHVFASDIARIAAFYRFLSASEPATYLDADKIPQALEYLGVDAHEVRIPITYKHHEASSTSDIIHLDMGKPFAQFFYKRLVLQMLENFHRISNRINGTNYPHNHRYQSEFLMDGLPKIEGLNMGVSIFNPKKYTNFIQRKFAQLVIKLTGPGVLNDVIDSLVDYPAHDKALLEKISITGTAHRGDEHLGNKSTWADMTEVPFPHYVTEKYFMAIETDDFETLQQISQCLPVGKLITDREITSIKVAPGCEFSLKGLIDKKIERSSGTQKAFWTNFKEQCFPAPYVPTTFPFAFAATSGAGYGKARDKGSDASSTQPSELRSEDLDDDSDFEGNANPGLTLLIESHIAAQAVPAEELAPC